MGGYLEPNDGRLIFQLLLLSMYLMSENRENDNRCDERRDEVKTGDDAGVNVDLVVKLVVRAKHDEAAPRNSQAEKHLLGGFSPHGEVGKLLPFGDEQKL